MTLSNPKVSIRREHGRNNMHYQNSLMIVATPTLSVWMSIKLFMEGNFHSHIMGRNWK